MYVYLYSTVILVRLSRLLGPTACPRQGWLRIYARREFSTQNFGNPEFISRRLIKAGGFNRGKGQLNMGTGAVHPNEAECASSGGVQHHQPPPQVEQAPRKGVLQMLHSRVSSFIYRCASTHTTFLHGNPRRGFQWHVTLSHIIMQFVCHLRRLMTLLSAHHDSVSFDQLRNHDTVNKATNSAGYFIPLDAS